MKPSAATKLQETNPLQSAFTGLGKNFSGKARLIVMAVLIVGGGMILKWDWLTAAGIAPLILAILPCAVMCALGLCACKMTGNKSSGSDSAAPPKPTDAKQTGNEAI